MSSCGLKIPMKEQSFLRTGRICFWQNTISFSDGEKKKECGKSSGNLARLLGHGLCVTKHIFDELSVNQSKPDRLSSLCWF